MKNLEIGNNIQDFYLSNIYNKLNDDVSRFLNQKPNKEKVKKDFNLNYIKYNKDFKYKKEDNFYHFEFSLYSRFSVKNDEYNIDIERIWSYLENIEKTYMGLYTNLEELNFKKDDSIVKLKHLKKNEYDLTIYLIFDFKYNQDNWKTLLLTILSQFMFNCVIKIFLK